MPHSISRILSITSVVFALSACGSEKERKSGAQNNPILISLKDYETDHVQLTQEEECQAFLRGESKTQVLPLYRDVFVSDKFSGKGGAQIHYYGYVFKNNKSPIIFYNGGPSSDSHGMLTAFKEINEYFKQLIYKEQSFILMDQRGTGCSAKYPNARFVSEEETPAFLQKLQDDWGSSAIVEDSEILRKKLFGDSVKWKIYGQSYGALIAHRYLELAPEGLDSVHAHGFGITDPASLNRFRYHSQKLVFEQFLVEYPETRPAVAKLYQWLDSGVCFHNGDEKEKVCGREALDPLVSAMANKLNWKDVSEILISIVQEDAINYEKVGKLVKRLQFIKGGDLSQGIAALVISLSEIDYGRNLDDPNGCEDAILYWESKGEPNSQWYIAECRPGNISAEGKEYLKIFMDLPIKPVSLETIKENIDTYKIPFYLYSSAHDLLVPPPMFTKEVEQLGASVKYHNFPTSGHEGFLTEALVWENLETPSWQ